MITIDKDRTSFLRNHAQHRPQKQFHQPLLFRRLETSRLQQKHQPHHQGQQRLETSRSLSQAMLCRPVRSNFIGVFARAWSSEKQHSTTPPTTTTTPARTICNTQQQQQLLMYLHPTIHYVAVGPRLLKLFWLWLRQIQNILRWTRLHQQMASTLPQQMKQMPA